MTLTLPPNRVGSAAEQGVVVGDTILAVDGSKVGDHAKAIAQMESGTGPTCTLTLAGTTHELVLQKSSGRIGITCTNRSGPGSAPSPPSKGLRVHCDGVASACAAMALCLHAFPQPPTCSLACRR